MEVLKKIKIELLCDPAILLLGIYLKKNEKKKKNSSKDICTPMFTEALFTIGKIWRQPKCLSTDEWIKKIFYL